MDLELQSNSVATPLSLGPKETRVIISLVLLQDVVDMLHQTTGHAGSVSRSGSPLVELPLLASMLVSSPKMGETDAAQDPLVRVRLVLRSGHLS